MGSTSSTRPENERLQAKIGETGFLISEMLPGTVPRGVHFPRRNRIISGASLGVIVVEAALRSGSLITARLAGEQGRDVFAVPGSPLDPRAEGTNRLIRDGATLVTSADDILEALERFPRQPRRQRPTSIWPMTYRQIRQARPDRSRIASLLSPAAVDFDTLIRESGAPPSSWSPSCLSSNWPASHPAPGSARLPGLRRASEIGCGRLRPVRDHEGLLESHFKELREEFETISTGQIAQFEAQIGDVVSAFRSICLARLRASKGLARARKNPLAEPLFPAFFAAIRSKTSFPTTLSEYNISVSYGSERNLKLSLGTK